MHGSRNSTRIHEQHVKALRALRADPKDILTNTAVINVRGEEGIWFVFPHPAEHLKVNDAATALNKQGLTVGHDDGVVKLMYGGKTFFAISVHRQKMAELVDQRRTAETNGHATHEDNGVLPILPYVHAHIGGESLPTVAREDAATLIFQHFQTKIKSVTASQGAV